MRPQHWSIIGSSATAQALTPGYKFGRQAMLAAADHERIESGLDRLREIADALDDAEGTVAVFQVVDFIAIVWAPEADGRAAIVICQQGAKLSQGVAAWLRRAGVPADILEDGFEGWRKANLPTVAVGKMPASDKDGRTVWVTRVRPKVDRIACPGCIALP